MFQSERLRVRIGGLPPGQGQCGVGLVNRARPCLSFPLMPALVEKEGMGAFVAGPNRASFFNTEQHYRVTRLHPAGSRSLRFYFDPRLVGEALGGIPEWSGDPQRPFTAASALVGHGPYLLHRLLERHLQEEGRPDSALVEEAAVRLLRLALRGHERAIPPVTSRATRAAHDQAVRSAERFMAMHQDEPIALADIGRAACLSPTHLCRVYRARTGITVHGFLLSQRLRRAIDLLINTADDTSLIAAQCGFSSRSHLSDALYRATGIRPKGARFGGSAREVRRILDALSREPA